MARYRSALPQLEGGLFLTDGGIETTLIFHEGFELPDFAAFHLLRTTAGEAALEKYFRGYAEIAERYGAGLILESATWRASADWGRRLGYSREELAEANRRAIALLERIRGERAGTRRPIVVSGCVGPRGDGYVADRAMSAGEAEAYHGEQIETFAATDADMVCATTMNYAEEAEGVARAARAAGMPVAISFTVETDGRLPTGQALGDAMAQVDAASASYPAYYMLNCAHPSHFEETLAALGPSARRIRGLRANASTKSHAELNESATLDVGDPRELGRDHGRLKQAHPRLNVFGGCCGTDGRHVEAIAKECAPLFGSDG
ncbi:MAG: homocysteine S-methyltransferase family protein [Thermoanaerobaculia bacterium]